MGYSDWENNNQPAQERDHDWQASPGDFTSIPVIDVGSLRSDAVDERRKVAAKIRDACTRVGFFYIENHGIPQELVDAVFQQADAFFSLPFDQKMEVFIANSPNFRGYTPVGASGKPGPDGKGNLNESFQWGLDDVLNDDASDEWIDLHMKGPNRWPREPASLEEHLSRYYRELRGFGRLLARAVALSLDLPENYFESILTHPGCSVVMTHYPPQERNSAARGLDAHTDSEFFTILAPGTVRALEVANKSGQWITAPPKLGTFVVNVGDQLQALTNNIYVSTRHRVMNYSGQERYSVPFFFMPNYETIIRPIPELVTGKHEAKYPIVSAGKMYKDNMDALHQLAVSSPEYARFLSSEAPTAT